MSRGLIILFCFMTSLSAAIGTVGALRTPTLFTVPGWWGGAEYLTVWREPLYFPPLVTTSPVGTPDDIAGFLGYSTTSIVFGQDKITGAPVAGVQGDGGMWITPVFGVGLGVYTFGVQKIQDNWDANALGSPILARPYYDVVAQAQNALLVSYPDYTTWGEIDIESINRIWGYDLYVRMRKVWGRHVTCDLLGGFCYTQIVDNCNIASSIDDGILYFADDFACRNDYYAGMVGFDVEFCMGKLRWDITGQVGLGNMLQRVITQGFTEIEGTNYPGGLLVLPSNLGTFRHHLFEVGSILDTHLRLSLFGHLHLAVGYKFWYFPKVLLSGKVISLDLNTTQAEGGTLSGQVAPLIDFNNVSFWTQSVGGGFYFVY